MADRMQYLQALQSILQEGRESAKFLGEFIESGVFPDHIALKLDLARKTLLAETDLLTRSNELNLKLEDALHSMSDLVNTMSTIVGENDE